MFEFCLLMENKQKEILPSTPSQSFMKGPYCVIPTTTEESSSRPQDEPYILDLRPFAETPKVDFGTVLVGTAVSVDVWIRNSYDSPVQVMLDKVPAKSNFEAKPLSMNLEGGETKRMVVRWSPTCEGSTRGMIRLVVNEAFRMQFVVLGCAVGSAKARKSKHPGSRRHAHVGGVCQTSKSCHVFSDVENLPVPLRDDEEDPLGPYKNNHLAQTSDLTFQYPSRSCTFIRDDDEAKIPFRTIDNRIESFEDEDECQARRGTYLKRDLLSRTIDFGVHHYPFNANSSNNEGRRHFTSTATRCLFPGNDLSASETPLVHHADGSPTKYSRQSKPPLSASTLSKYRFKLRPKQDLRKPAEMPEHRLCEQETLNRSFQAQTEWHAESTKKAMLLQATGSSKPSESRPKNLSPMHFGSTAHPTINHIYNQGFQMAVTKFTLKKCLLLVYFLDVAKSQKLIRYNPCLFANTAPFKTSKDILLAFSRECLRGEGDITRHLSYMGYIVICEQTVMDEFDYTATNLSQDLRDGIRLAHLLEVLINDWSLSKRLLPPPLNKTKKIHNVEVVLETLKMRRVSLALESDAEEITAKDIVGGHRQRTLQLLWRIIFSFQVTLLLDERLLQDELNILLKDLPRDLRDKINSTETNILGSVRNTWDSLAPDLYNDDPLPALLLKWCRVVCFNYGMKVENFTVSFSEGLKKSPFKNGKPPVMSIKLMSCSPLPDLHAFHSASTIVKSTLTDSTNGSGVLSESPQKCSSVNRKFSGSPVLLINLMRNSSLGCNRKDKPKDGAGREAKTPVPDALMKEKENSRITSPINSEADKSNVQKKMPDFHFSVTNENPKKKIISEPGTPSKVSPLINTKTLDASGSKNFAVDNFLDETILHSITRDCGNEVVESFKEVSSRWIIKKKGNDLKTRPKNNIFYRMSSRSLMSSFFCIVSRLFNMPLAFTLIFLWALPTAHSMESNKNAITEEDSSSLLTILSLAAIASVGFLYQLVDKWRSGQCSKKDRLKAITERLEELKVLGGRRAKVKVGYFFEKKVAIKQIEGDLKGMERARKELEMLKRTKHLEDIIDLLFKIDVGQVTLLVAEYYEMSLGKFIKTNPSVQEKLIVLHKIVKAVKSLHELGLAHTDLTQNNIFVIKNQNGFRVKLSNLRRCDDVKNLAPPKDMNGDLPNQKTQSDAVFTIGKLTWRCFSKNSQVDLETIHAVEELKAIPFAVHALTRLMDPVSKERASAEEASMLPLFWKPGTIPRFFEVLYLWLSRSKFPISSKLEKSKYSRFNPSAFSWTEIAKKSEVYKVMTNPIHESGQKIVYNDSLYDFVRFARNLYVHRLENNRPKQLREIDQIDEYLKKNFEDLIVHIFNVCIRYVDDVFKDSLFYGSSIA